MGSRFNKFDFFFYGDYFSMEKTKVEWRDLDFVRYDDLCQCRRLPLTISSSASKLFTFNYDRAPL